MIEQKRIAWVSRVTGPNSNHKKYIESLGSDLLYIDWDDHAFFLKRYFNWIRQAWNFPSREKYDVFISIDVKFPVILMRWLGRLRPHQKIICFHATETLYFLREKRYAWFTRVAFKRALRSYDGHICVSRMCTQLLEEITRGRAKNVLTMFNGVSKERMKKYAGVSPALDSNTILFVGNLYAGWRSWYKGIDLLLDAFGKSLSKKPALKLIIVGECTGEIMQWIREHYSAEVLDRITFAGRQEELEHYFSAAALYLHCARGEAFGVSVVEAMAAGMPVLVSEWTGAKEVAERAGAELVVPLQADRISEKLEWYFGLSPAERQALSVKCREAAAPNTQELAIAQLKKCVELIIAQQPG